MIPKQSQTTHRTPAPRRHLHPRWILVLLAVLLVASPALGKRKSKQGEINGRVMTQTGETLSGVAVKVTGADFEEQTTSDRKGEFKVEIPGATGSYMVHLSLEGYTDFEAAIDLEVGDQQNIDFRLIDEATGRKQQAVEAYNAGVRAFNAGEKDEALARFTDASTLDPELPQPLLGLADLHIEAERFAEAAAAAERYLALQPDDVNATRLAYEAYVGLGDEEKASALRSALGGSAQAGGLAIQAYNEGAVATQQGDLATAVARFEAALELDPELAQAWAGLASVYYNQENYSKALEAADTLLAMDSESVQGRRVRFLVQDALNNDPAAFNSAFDAYAEVDAAGAVDVLYQRADLDFRAGEMATAQKALQKILALQPDFPRAHYTLGLTYAQSDTAKAREHLERFIELAPDDPEVEMAQSMLSYF